MKSIIRITCISALVCLTAKAAPFMAVGDNAELFVTAGGLVSTDDNIFLNATGAKSDTVYSFSPGLDLVFGKGSVTSGNVFFKEEFRRYSSNSAQNVDLANVGLNSSYSNGLTKASFNAAYAEIAQNQVGATLTSAIARRDVSNVAGKTEFSISEKTMLSVGMTYDSTQYAPASFTDSDILAFPIDVFYQATAKLAWSAGYTYRSTSLNGTGIDNQDNFFNLGARGEFTPLLSGQVKVGYTSRSFDVGKSQNLFGVQGNLTFQATEKSTLQFNIANDFGNAGTGDSTKNFTLGANYTGKLTDQFSLNAGISRRAIEYPTRTDTYVEGSVGLTYVYSTYVNFNGTYTYRNNSSDKLASADFTNNVFSLGVNVRY